jgi:serine/threonine protein kinase/Tfp pilus assembly protein PilF
MALRIGTRLGPYEIVAPIGAGGMGEVYRARDDRLRREVALKVLSCAVSGKTDHERILAEARAASRLQHPGIVTIHDVGDAGGQPFMVMELVEGRQLREMIAAGPLEIRAVLRIGAALADALGAAHAAGVIHGDIKPHNVVVQPDGRVKLLDFGIARRLQQETVTRTLRSLTRTMPRGVEIAGTFSYMAPEQLRGAPADARSDLYALGTVLYELVVGVRPFLGPTTALVHQVLHDPPPSLPSDGRVPVRLAQAIASLLEKDPAVRPSSAHQLHQELTALLHDLELGKRLEKVAAGKTSVAVLPFRLLTPGAEDEYLSVALADAAINSLSLSPKLILRPTSAVLQYNKADAATAGRELNVDVVVEGSVQKYGQKLRVHVTARRLADDTTLVSARQESEMPDLFGLQDRIAETLANALGAGPEVTQTAHPPTDNALAYELYLRAGDRMSRLNRWDILTAVSMLENATSLDRGFADAWGRLAEACIQMAVVFENKPQWFRKAEQAIRKALQLDRSNAEALSAKGQLLWTPAKKFANVPALKALDKALEANPGCHQAQIWRGLILLHLGLHEDARRGLLAALATNPNDARTLCFVGQTAAFQGKYEEAEEYNARAVVADPANMWVNLFYPVLYMSMGKPEKAAEKIRIARQLLPQEPTLTSVEALLCAQRGENRKAGQLLDKALRGGKPLLHTHHMWHYAAGVYATIGQPAKAVTWLRKAAGFGLPNYPLFGTDPLLKPLQNQTTYLRFMADLKRTWEQHKRAFGKETSTTF